MVDKFSTSPKAASRDRSASREAILAAAEGIARRDGWPAVTIRRIADELGYTSPIIYQHFANKEAALAQLALDGFGKLEQALALSVEGLAEPERRVLAMARAYWEFAHRNPESYQVMHSLGGVTLDPSITARGALSVCGLAMGELQDWAHAADCRLGNALEATELLWCTLHGMTSLALVSRLDAEANRTAQRIDKAMRVLLAGWRAESN